MVKYRHKIYLYTSIRDIGFCVKTLIADKCWEQIRITYIVSCLHIRMLERTVFGRAVWKTQALCKCGPYLPFIFPLSEHVAVFVLKHRELEKKEVWVRWVLLFPWEKTYEPKPVADFVLSLHRRKKRFYLDDASFTHAFTWTLWQK